jgi:hypothetical protein
MVEFPSRHKLPALDEVAEPIPPGASLWDMALEGRGRSSPAEGGPERGSATPRFRPRLWMAGVAGVLVLGGAVGLLGLAGGTVSSDRPSGQAVGPGPGIPQLSVGTTRHGSSSCSAQSLIPTPVSGTTDEIVVSNVPPGSAVTVELAYAGGSAHYSVASDPNGVTSVPVSLTGVPASQAVDVAVTAGNSSCHTSFTPSASTSP